MVPKFNKMVMVIMLMVIILKMGMRKMLKAITKAMMMMETLQSTNRREGLCCNNCLTQTTTLWRRCTEINIIVRIIMRRF